MHSCPLLSNRLPSHACPFALNAIKNLRSHNDIIKFKLLDIHITTDEECDWYILDEASNWCFWAFWANPSNIREYKLEDVAKLLGLCTEAVYFAEKKGMYKMAQFADILLEEGKADITDLDRNVAYYKSEVNWSMADVIEEYNILSESFLELQKQEKEEEGSVRPLKVELEQLKFKI